MDDLETDVEQFQFSLGQLSILLKKREGSDSSSQEIREENKKKGTTIKVAMTSKKDEKVDLTAKSSENETINTWRKHAPEGKDQKTTAKSRENYRS